jgi:hypothetical protein
VIAVDVLADARWDELLAEYTELNNERHAFAAQLKKRFPQGFTGNGVPGEFESLEMDYSDAERDFRDWLASDDGQEFKTLRAARHGASA